MKYHLLLPLCGSLITGSVFAETESDNQTDEQDTSPYSGSVKLGFIYSQNTDTSLSINSGATLIYQKSDWHHKADLATYYTNSNSESDGTKKYSATYGAKYDFSEDNFVFGHNKYEYDQFGTYRDQVVVVAGFGAIITRSEQTTINIGAGPGYRFSQRQSNDADFPNQITEELITNGFIEGTSALTQSLEIGGKVNVDYGEENTSTNVKGYIKNQLMDKLALLIDTEYIYNSTVASDQNNDELYSTVNITYDF